MNISTNGSKSEEENKNMTLDEQFAFASKVLGHEILGSKPKPPIQETKKPFFLPHLAPKRLG